MSQNLGQLKWLESSGQDTREEEALRKGFPNVSVWIPHELLVKGRAVYRGERLEGLSEWLLQSWEWNRDARGCIAVGYWSSGPGIERL